MSTWGSRADGSLHQETYDANLTPEPIRRRALKERTISANHGILGVVHLVLPAARLSSLSSTIQRFSAEVEDAAAAAQIHLVHGGGLLRCLQAISATTPGPTVICWDRCDPPVSNVELVIRRLDELASEGSGLILIGDGLPAPNGPHSRLLPEIKPLLRILLDACRERPVAYICNAFGPDAESDGQRWDECLDRLIQRRRLKRFDPTEPVESGSLVGVIGLNPQRLLESRSTIRALGGRALLATPCTLSFDSHEGEVLVADVDRAALLEVAAQRVIAHMERRGALRSGVVRLPVAAQVSQYRRGRGRLARP